MNRGLRKTIVSFIKNQSIGLALTLGSFIISIIVFFLYRIPIEPLLYVYTIHILIGGFLGIYRFCRFLKKHNELEYLKHKKNYEVEELPDTKDQIERDYQELITIVNEQMHLIENATNESQRDLLDYYTLWAHQIKTPIAALKLLVQTQEVQGNQVTWLEEVKEQLFKIEQYVEMVLQYLRMDGMSSDLLLKEYDLDAMVKQAVKKYAKMFIRKNISLSYEPLHCKVLTDEKWLVFVIEQILSNAIKYTPTGTISIYLKSGEKKVLVIEDSGIGIWKEDLPRVFEKGFTGYNGREDKKSTGIGLYLCSQVMKRLSHGIKIEATTGVGTKVYLYLDREAYITE